MSKIGRVKSSFFFVFFDRNKNKKVIAISKPKRKNGIFAFEKTSATINKQSSKNNFFSFVFCSQRSSKNLIRAIPKSGKNGIKILFLM